MAGPLAYAFWVLPPADAPPGDDDLARMLLAVRLGPLLLALGEAARAASTFMRLAAGLAEPTERALAHVGVVAAGVLVALALAPSPLLGLLALAILGARHAAAAELLKEPVAWAAALALIAFGAACEAGGEGLVLGGFIALGAIAALTEVIHAVRLTRTSGGEAQSSSGGSGAS
ncbi:MAG: hypothetical protein U1F43_38285 [Myxococcota bacterium]